MANEINQINRFDAKHIATDIAIFDSEIKYPAFPNDNDMTDILKRVSNRSYVKSSTVQEMLSDLLAIENYALLLQDQENQARRIINWCENNLEYLVGQEAESIPDYIGTYMPNRLIYIKANHAKGQELDKQRLLAQIRLDTISKIHFGLQRMADALKTAIHMRKERYNAFRE